jgi:dihydropteroate synthase
LILGIVNVTPDSFFDGGRHAQPEQAIAHGRRLAEDGADILDLGGESTRPGADEVDAGGEWERVGPVIAGLSAALPEAPLSIDTYKAEVAIRALEAGASIVNDVSGCVDPALREALAQYKPGYALMHSQGNPKDMQRDPRYQDVVEEVFAFLESRLAALVKAGLPEDRVVVDPGIGFGKTLEHNLELLRRIDRFAALGRPVLLGVSNKSLWSGLLGLPVAERGNATQAATAVAAMKGVRLHRVHDVRLTRQTLRVVQATG